jgi:uncharacterized protein
VVRLGVIGDTQGRFSVDDLMAKVRVHFKDVDQVWHAGDWQSAEVLEQLRDLGKPLIVVNGNAPDDPSFPMTVTHEFHGFKVGMVHRPPNPNDPWVQALNVLIHGHTHIWRDQVIGNTRFINVASATGAWNTKNRSAGILTLDSKAIVLQRIDL